MVPNGVGKRSTPSSGESLNQNTSLPIGHIVGRNGRVVGNLLGDIVGFAAIRVLPITAKSLTQNWVVWLF